MPDDPITEALALASTDPGAAVQQAWFAIHEANNRNQRRVTPGYVDVSPLARTARAVRDFADAGHIDVRYGPVTEQLFALMRDAHLNPSSVSPAAAALYVEQAADLIAALDSAT